MCTKDERAVAGVVGAVLITGVIMVALTLITVYYVPVWVEGEEVKHMQKVAEQFEDLKYNIDLQILRAFLSGVNVTTLYSEITLGSEGNPFFDITRLTGRLNIEPLGCKINISTSDGICFTSIGTIKFKSENRYYIQQSYTYENGAVILSQPEGNVFKCTPPFMFTKIGDALNLSASLITLKSENAVYSGSTTRLISTTPVFVWQYEFRYAVGANITINITSEYTDIYKEWFEAQYGYLSDYTVNVYDGMITIIIYGVTYFKLVYANIELKVS